MRKLLVTGLLFLLFDSGFSQSKAKVVGKTKMLCPKQKDPSDVNAGSRDSRGGNNSTENICTVVGFSTNQQTN